MSNLFHVLEDIQCQWVYEENNLIIVFETNDCFGLCLTSNVHQWVLTKRPLILSKHSVIKRKARIKQLSWWLWPCLLSSPVKKSDCEQSTKNAGNQKESLRRTQEISYLLKANKSSRYVIYRGKMNKDDVLLLFL